MSDDLEKKIISQLEYYFGDFNLGRDKFMREQSKLDDGWIPLEVLLTFKRLANLSEDPKVVGEAATKASPDILEVNEEKTRIRRSPDNPVPELNEEKRKEMVTRTAYAKGFPLEEKLDQIMEFMQEYGPIESVYQRKYSDKATKEQKFKGSCFIIFKDIEHCKKFIEQEELKYGEKALIRKWQADYIEEKKKEREEHKIKCGRGEEKKEVKEEKKHDFPKGAVLHFEGIKEETEISREDIKEKIKQVGDVEVAFIDYSKGQASGHVRFPTENSAVEFVKKLEEENKLKVGEATLDVRCLEGEEEEKYLEETVANIEKRRQANKKGRGGGFGGGRSNRKRHHNGNNRDRSDRSAKKAKV